MEPITIIEVVDGNFDPFVVRQSAMAHFPDATFEDHEHFSHLLEFWKSINAAECVVNSTRRLAARVAPAYGWLLPQPQGLQPVKCGVRRDWFFCMVTGQLDWAIRLRIIAFAQTLGVPEISE